MTEQEIIEKIKEIDDGLFTSTFKKILRDNPEINNYILQIIKKYKFLKIEKDAVYYIKYRN